MSACPVLAQAVVAFLHEPFIQQMSQARKPKLRVLSSPLRYEGQFCQRDVVHFGVWHTLTHPSTFYCQALRVSRARGTQWALPHLHLYWSVKLLFQDIAFSV